MNSNHKPVLLDEVIKALNIHSDGFYIDGTFGRGGHSREIIKRLGRKGRLLAFDKDPDAVMSVGMDLIEDDRFEIIKGSFTMLMKYVKNMKLKKKFLECYLISVFLHRSLMMISEVLVSNMIVH